MRRTKIKTGVAFIIWATLLTAGYYYTGFKPDAQFWIYALFLTLGLGGYTGKRLLQRLPRFNNYEKDMGVGKD